MSVEILIYVDKVKHLFSMDNKVKNYFLSNCDEKQFFLELFKQATINNEKNGTPELSEEQFELIKNKTTIKSKIYFDMGQLGLVCLN